MRVTTIREVNDLLDWLADRLREKKPQEPIANGAIALFDRLVHDMKEQRFGALAFSLDTIISIVDANHGTSPAYAGLRPFLELLSEYRSITSSEESDGVETFINLIAEEIGLGDRDLRIIKSYPLKIKSGQGLRKRYGLSVDIAEMAEKRRDTRSFKDLH